MCDSFLGVAEGGGEVPTVHGFAFPMPVVSLAWVPAELQVLGFLAFVVSVFCI